MLVIHPTDPTTTFLRALYEDREDVRVLHGQESKKELSKIIFHLKPGEPIYLLGHGNDQGLFRLQDGVNTLYVGRSMAYSLRKHPVIGIFCHASVFAEQQGLHGLFSGMIISEESEAEDDMYKIKTSKEELENENTRFAKLLAGFLSAGLPFPEIPVMMQKAVEDGPAVRFFNYNSLYVL